ncbi:chromate efflux transporter [Microbacteriaceae bacterium 4G12]
MKQYWDVFWIALRLGCISFGGPTAHMSYFRDEYVEKRKWMDEKSYADVVALANFLPGPASSQVGMAMGITRGGLTGGILAWLGFTLPSMIILMLFAMFVQAPLTQASWIHSLKLVAVVVVAQAVFEMGKKLAPDRMRQTLLLAVTVSIFLFPSSYTQLFALIGSGIVGYIVYNGYEETSKSEIVSLSKRTGLLAFTSFFGLLVLLPLLRTVVSSKLFALFAIMYRTGSLVFGGGHVVLPLLEQEIVRNGWMSKDLFLAGYGLTQAVPGPLFTFATYIGAVTHGFWGAIVATIGIFLPAFLLIVDGLSSWNTMRQNKVLRPALLGINAGVVGILLAASYDPIFIGAVKTTMDIVLVFLYFMLLHVWRLSPWMVVAIAFICGFMSF